MVNAIGVYKNEIVALNNKLTQAQENVTKNVVQHAKTVSVEMRDFTAQTCIPHAL